MQLAQVIRADLHQRGTRSLAHDRSKFNLRQLQKAPPARNSWMVGDGDLLHKSSDGRVSRSPDRPTAIFLAGMSRGAGVEDSGTDPKPRQRMVEVGALRR